MTVRIRFKNGPKIRMGTGKNRNLALAAATLLSPATLLAFVLAFWRMSSDIGTTSAFPITDGLLSHWQVWLAIALFAQFLIIVLNRYGRHGSFRDTRVPTTGASLDKAVADRAG
jgi:hypothetical protein